MSKKKGNSDQFLVLLWEGFWGQTPDKETSLLRENKMSQTNMSQII